MGPREATRLRLATGFGDQSAYFRGNRTEERSDLRLGYHELRPREKRKDRRANNSFKPSPLRGLGAGVVDCAIAAAANRSGLTQALGVLMLHVEHRQMFAINGLIDDFVLYGKPSDYVEFARAVESASHGEPTTILHTATSLRIEINNEPEIKQLMTSLQNQANEYLSTDDWAKRDILRVWGSQAILKQLHTFLIDLSGRGEGYSYLAEFSEEDLIHHSSPEWRLHVLY